MAIHGASSRPRSGSIAGQLVGQDQDVDGDEGASEHLSGYAAPSQLGFLKPVLRLIVSQSDSRSSKTRSSLLKFAFDDEDGKLSAALIPTSRSSKRVAIEDGALLIDDAFEAAAMASRDVILEWLRQVSAGEVESF